MDVLIDYSTLTDGQLEAAERYAVIDVKAAEKHLSEHQQKLAIIQTELARRTLLTLPIGTKVRDAQYGDGEIVRIEEGLTFCVVALFASGEKRFTVQGAAQMRFMYEHGEAV